MASVNSVTLIGNATKDAEVKVLSNGQPVANFGLATTDRWVDRDSGQQKEATEFHNITAFRKLAELAERFVSKGSQLYIEGYGAKSIADQLGCDIQLVYDWIKHIGVSEPEEFSPHSTINSQFAPSSGVVEIQHPFSIVVDVLPKISYTIG